MNTIHFEQRNVSTYASNFDALLDPEREPILWRERLKSEAPFSSMHWDTRSSGVTIPDGVARALESVWADLVDPAA